MSDHELEEFEEVALEIEADEFEYRTLADITYAEAVAEALEFEYERAVASGLVRGAF